MNNENGKAIKRLQARLVQPLIGEDKTSLSEYILTYPLRTIRKVLLSLNVTNANSRFPEIANNADKMSELIISAIHSRKESSPLAYLHGLVNDAKEDFVPIESIAWIKKDAEACYYFWSLLINLEWTLVFTALKDKNFHSYSSISNNYNQEHKFVVDTLKIPIAIASHKTRYSSIVNILNELPFSGTEIGKLIAIIFHSYKSDKANCNKKANIDLLIKNKEVIIFSLSYLQKKGISAPYIEPLTESDNKCSLVTQLYLLSRNDDFKALINAMIKAWSQKKIREKEKTINKKKVIEHLRINEESMKMLNELSSKYNESQTTLVNMAVALLYKEMS
ncbi:hypothetical protein ABRQ07_10730 [Pectobacterium polonicum]|uniref:Uncharacterized protein n=1 Tax=Pectobacterium polonicum TaxID=2485124 RepID=A0ABV1PA99_9GAMM|nr:hypothetical protein [Pectobacterium polonicum]MDC9818702.1 hypothetical protein [Pectobacterium polonicum]